MELIVESNVGIDYHFKIKNLWIHDLEGLQDKPSTEG